MVVQNLEGGREEQRGEPHPLVSKAEMGYLEIGMDGEGARRGGEGAQEGMKGWRHERKTRVKRGGKEKGGIKWRGKS